MSSPRCNVSHPPAPQPPRRRKSAQPRSRAGGTMSRMCLAALGMTLAVELAAPGPVRAACSITQGDFDQNGGQDVRIQGDALPQRIVITDGPGSYRVQVDCNANGLFTDPGDL